MVQGDCALCLISNAELRDSHYLPTSLVNVVRKSLSPHDSAPVAVNMERGTAVLTNRQEKKHLLCGACETLFSTKGENPVIRDCYRHETSFNLRDAMIRAQPTKVSNERRIFFGKQLLPDVNPANYFYFALSILWRGSVTVWPPPAHEFYNALGSQDQEQIRQYLLSPSIVPTKIMVAVYVDFDTDVKACMTYPSPKGDKPFGNAKCKTHHFLIPGLQFIVLVGEQTDLVASEASDSSHVTFYEWSFSGSNMYQGVAELCRSTEPKGKLAKRRPGSNAADLKR